MRIRNIVSHTIGFILAFIVVAVFYNSLLHYYYLLPPKINVPGKATQQVWFANQRVITGAEGFGHNQTDSFGYNNAEDLSRNARYWLALGTSHTEAFNVDYDENYCTLLTGYFAKSKIKIYNAGMDGHTFTHLAKNFKAAMAEFPEASGVIIEMDSIAFTEDKLRDALNQVDYNPEIPGATQKYNVVNSLQSMPLIRLMYRQVVNTKSGVENAFLPRKVNVAESNSSQIAEDEYFALLNKVMSRMASETNKPVIIFYLPKIALEKDGTLTYKTDMKILDLFCDACEKNGFIFLDLSGAFRDAYYSRHVLPYGFNNTVMGQGHLNKYGHKIVADELKRTMVQYGGMAK